MKSRQWASCRAALDGEPVRRYDAADLTEHLQIISPVGDVKCYFVIGGGCILSLESVVPSLENYLKRSIPLVDVLLLVLVDLVAQEDATEVPAKLGVRPAESAKLPRDYQEKTR